MDILVTRQLPDQVRSSPQGLTVIILLEGTANATGQGRTGGTKDQGVAPAGKPLTRTTGRGGVQRRFLSALRMSPPTVASMIRVLPSAHAND